MSVGENFRLITCSYTYKRAYTHIVVMFEVEERNNEVTVTRNAWFTLAILSSTLLVVFFSETMLLPAIPEIMRDFSISYGTAAWIFSAYLIVAAVMTPIARPKAAEVMTPPSHARRPLMDGMAASAASLITCTTCSGASMLYE